MNLPRLIDRFRTLSPLVIGDAMLDVYLEGTTGRICREAPVPIVSLYDRRMAPGGAANVAVNLADLGSAPSFLSVVGDDPEGATLRASLKERGVRTDCILAEPRRQTISKSRVIAASHMMVRFDQGSAQPIGESTEQELINRLTELFPRCDVVIVSDYGYGVLTERVIGTLAYLQRRFPRPIVADSKNPATLRQVGITAVKPNYAEASELLGLKDLESGHARADQIAAEADRLFELTNSTLIAVTLDTDGSLVFERGKPPYRTYARPTRHSRAAGAGDTYVSGMALALAAGASTPACAELAAAAAAVVVGKEGTTSCSAGELREYITGGDRSLIEADRLYPRVEFIRQQCLRIVFTNGCFDILQRGHITYLNCAKALGDVLIVGVNSDSSVRRLRGPGRPINSLEDRAKVLAALSCVDLVVAFDTDMPTDLIRTIRPDIYVKGGDYTREMLPEASLVEELGGVVQILPYVEDYSTNDMIERIRGTYEASLDRGS